MKKLIMMLAVIATALVSNASYLFWQVSSSDYEGSLAEGDTVSWASIFYTTTGTASGGTKLANYYIDETSSTSLGDKVVAPSSDMFAANVSDLGTPSSYSYYVELYNSSNQTVARSIATTISSDSKAWADTGSTVGSMVDIPSVASIAPFHAGSYSAVPEPTSAILMLFGAAFLGLKRKNRSLA